MIDTIRIQRYELYSYVLESYNKNPQYGICFHIFNIFRSDNIYNNMRYDYPELFELKPKKTFKNSPYWFSFNRRGIRKRKCLLTKILKNGKLA